MKAGENDVTREEDYDFTAEENAADEEKSGASAPAEDDEEEEEDVDEVDEAGSAGVSQKAAVDMADSDEEDNESLAKMKKARGARKLMLEDDEEEEGAAVEEVEDADEENAEEDEEAEDMDKTFIAPYMKTRRGTGADEDEASEDLQETESADEAGEGEGEGDEGDEGIDEEDDDDDVHIVGRKRRRMVDPGREKRQRIQQYYCKGNSPPCVVVVFRLLHALIGVNIPTTIAVTYNSPTALMLLPFVKARVGAHGHMPLDITWQAILGMTDQFLKGRLSEDQYEACCQYLKIELGDHLISASDRVSYNVQGEAIAPNAAGAVATVAAGGNPTTNVPLASTAATAATGGPTNISIGGAQAGHIQETAEYRFYLHRHWSLYEAMFHSSYVASRFPIWNSRGKTKLQELLAEMGVPLYQCKQLFSFMTPEIRQHFGHQIRDPVIQEKYKLSDPDCTYKSFCRFTSYKNPMAAEDIVQAATSLLELYAKQKVYAVSGDDGKETLTMSLIGGKENMPPSAVTIAGEVANKDTFVDAYALLGTRNDPLVKKGIQLALDIQRAIVKKSSAMLDGQDSIHRYHRIYYAYIRNNLGQHPSLNNSNHSSHNSHTNNPGASQASNAAAVLEMQKELTSELIFGRPMVLARLGQYIMEVKRNQSKKEGGWTGSSLLPLILLSERADGSYLVMGISPFATTSGQRNINEEHLQRLRPLTNFRQFFKLAAKDMHIKYRFNCKFVSAVSVVCVCVCV